MIDNDTYAEMMRNFDCVLLGSGRGRENAARQKRRDRVDKTFNYFKRVRPYAADREQALRMVRDQWTAGMNPIVAWALWTIVKALVQQVVYWLWEQDKTASRAKLWK